jgi:hypothetical protein
VFFCDICEPKKTFASWRENKVSQRQKVAKKKLENKSIRFPCFSVTSVSLKKPLRLGALARKMALAKTESLEEKIGK